MSKLRIIDAKRMERLLFLLSFERVCQREVTCFTDTLMEGLLPPHITGGGFLARPLIREILREMELTVDDYNKHLKIL